MNFKEIKELIKVFNNSNLSKLKIKNGEFGLTLKKGSKVATPTPIQTAPIQQPQTVASIETTTTKTEKKVVDDTDKITSPMVGTFYRAPSPDSPPFVNIGDSVKKGQTLCILEAMKIMNELEAEFDCKIIDILVEDGQPVEYDMPLFLVKKV